MHHEHRPQYAVIWHFHPIPGGAMTSHTFHFNCPHEAVAKFNQLRAASSYDGVEYVELMHLSEIGNRYIPSRIGYCTHTERVGVEA